MTGTIKRKVSKTPGGEPTFGFIRGDDGQDYFFLPMAMARGDFGTCREGDPVTFEAEDSPKGPRAIQVLVAER